MFLQPIRSQNNRKMSYFIKKIRYRFRSLFRIPITVVLIPNRWLCTVTSHRMDIKFNIQIKGYKIFLNFNVNDSRIFQQKHADHRWLTIVIYRKIIKSTLLVLTVNLSRIALELLYTNTTAIQLNTPKITKKYLSNKVL